MWRRALTYQTIRFQSLQVPRFTRALLNTLLALSLSSSLSLAQFRITDVSLLPAAELTVTVESSATNYYVLIRGDEVTRISLPRALELGQSGETLLSDPDFTGGSTRFYRAIELPVTAPRDLDGDGIDDVYELGLRPFLDPLDASDAGLDPDDDGLTTLQEYLQGSDPFSPSAAAATSYTSSPDQLETGISVTRETVLTFSAPLAPGTEIGPAVLSAEAAGRRLLTRAEISSDRRNISLFYQEPMPGASRVRVTFSGDLVQDQLGRAVDGDLDGRPGGTGYIEFETFGNQPLTGTAVIGQVFASELEVGGSGGFTNRPLAGVIITVDGAEETLRAATDADGRFILQPAPAGRFFVHIDGRTAGGSSWPDGSYYPVVGKAWEAVPGRTDNLAGETGLIYLPLVTAGTLQTISASQETTITFPEPVLAEHPELAGVEIRVPPNGLFSDAGLRGGKVGIAPVPPDRIPSPLPPGLNLPLVITIQTDGAQNFDRPVPVRFPNLPDPTTGVKLGPGEKSALWSFNHDTGQWEVIGPMTVTPDGNFVETDPGVGILQPGWHGVQPGVGASGGPLTGPCGGGGGSPGEDCRQNPDFPPDDPANYNGCGPDGWDYLVPDNPNGLLFPCASFFDACKAHDIGYNTCGKPKQETDDQFLNDMLAACDCFDGIKRTECRALAVLYHRAVTGGGADAYNDAQDKACICDTPPPSDGCDGGSGPSLQNTLGAQALSRRIARQGPRPADAGSTAELVPQLGPHRFAVIDLDSGQVVQRGRAGSAGVAFAELILAPRRNYDIAILQEATLREGKIRVKTGESGSRINLPPILIKPPVSWDFDGDGLHDAGELILGTDYRDPDSDDDGVLDGAEARQGSNPLDSTPLTTGIIGTARTPGRAMDVAALNNIAVTANDTAGIALFNISDPFSPTLLAIVDTPGQALGVSLADDQIAVADGSSGLAIIDATTPSAPFRRQQIALGVRANAVAAYGPIGYVGLDNGSVVAVDLRTGSVLERVSLGTAAIQDLVIHQETLFALAIGRLYLLPLDGGELRIGASIESAGSIGAGARRLRLFIGGGLAYATFTSGYNIFDVSDPDSPRLLRRNQTGQQGWKQIVASGSGLALATVSANSTDDGDHHVSLYRVGPDGTESEFLATFPTPGLATAVAIYNGLALVADGVAGLQIVNYLAFDRAGQPPTIQLAASFPLDPARAEEGKLVQLQAIVADDVQVRSVEFYLDDRLLVSDGNFEFETRFVTPLRSAQRSHFTLRARAIDTGGNTSSTETFRVELVADATPPRILRRFPAPGSIAGKVATVSVTFNEPVRPETLIPETVRLTSAGPDAAFGTSDDVPVLGATIEWQSDLNTLFLGLSENLAPGFYEIRLRPPISDLAGNPLPADVTWRFWVLGTEDTDQDGVPDNIEVALGLDPQKPDTDGDGILDGDEDPDGDRLRNSWELVFGYNPTLRDSDGNGINDEDEDPDLDGVKNAIESARNLSPVSPDTDGDGWDDNGEMVEGTDPLRPDSTPVRRVTSSAAAYLNAVAETLPPGTAIQMTSRIASYLNAVPETLPAEVAIEASSPIVSYLNAVADAPPAGTGLHVVSPTVSYLNASPEGTPAGVLLTVPSPVVSFHNQ